MSLRTPLAALLVTVLATGPAFAQQAQTKDEGLRPNLRADAKRINAEPVLWQDSRGFFEERPGNWWGGFALVVGGSTTALAGMAAWESGGSVCTRDDFFGLEVCTEVKVSNGGSLGFIVGGLGAVGLGAYLLKQGGRDNTRNLQLAAGPRGAVATFRW